MIESRRSVRVGCFPIAGKTEFGAQLRQICPSAGECWHEERWTLCGDFFGPTKNVLGCSPRTEPGSSPPAKGSGLLPNCVPEPAYAVGFQDHLRNPSPLAIWRDLFMSLFRRHKIEIVRRQGAIDEGLLMVAVFRSTSCRKKRNVLLISTPGSTIRLAKESANGLSSPSPSSALVPPFAA